MGVGVCAWALAQKGRLIDLLFVDSNTDDDADINAATAADSGPVAIFVSIVCF